MAWLVVDGTTVGVEFTSSRGQTVAIGQQGRAVSGAMRSSVVAYKGRWSFRTGFLTTAEKDTLKGKLEGTPPLTCSGDALGASTDCFVEPGSYEEEPAGPLGDTWRVSFTLEEE